MGRTKEMYTTEDLEIVASRYHIDKAFKSVILRELQRKTPTKLGIRRIDKMLDAAKEQGIVEIKFPQKPSVEKLLEKALLAKYAVLRHVTVVENNEDESYRAYLARLGNAAARYFDSLAAEGRTLHVGISGGETLLSFANAVSPHQRSHVHVYTTALVGRGELPNTASHVDPIVNASILWSRCGGLAGHCHYATVSPLATTERSSLKASLKELAGTDEIGFVLAQMKKINIAFVGLGSVLGDQASPDEVNSLSVVPLLDSVVSRSALLREGAFGDLAYNFFDRKGKGHFDRLPLKVPPWEFFLSAGYGDGGDSGVGFYKKMVLHAKSGKRVIVIAGRRKKQVIEVGLQAQMFNGLITDSETAAWLTDMSSILPPKKEQPS